MDFRILGHLEVSNEGHPLPIAGAKPRALLAMLLLHSGEVVPVDRLAEELWSGEPASGGAKNIQVHVSRIRRALGDVPEGASGSIVSRAGGYLLTIGEHDLDLHRFEQGLAEGKSALAADQPDLALARLCEALELWRGPPLADFSYDSFAQGEIARIEGLHLGAQEDLFEALLAIGRHADVIEEARALVADQPFRERVRGQLMLALYRSGRQADALEVYREGRRALVEELGLEPGHQLKQLEAQILAQDAELDPPQAAAPAGTDAAPPPRHRRKSGLALAGIGLAAAAVALVLVLTSGGTALPAVAANSVAAIDAESGKVVGDVGVGSRPGDVAVGAGAVWVANVGDGSVSRIDPVARRLVRTVPVGSAVSGLGSSGADVWTVDTSSVATARRIDPVFSHPDTPVRIGRNAGLLGRDRAPLAVGMDSVWAANGDSAVVRLDPRDGAVRARIDVGNDPGGIATGAGAVWVSDDLDDTVSRIDPSTDGVIETIPAGHGAAAIAVGAGAVWVARTLDDSVARIDPSTNSIVTTIHVGRAPSAIAISGNSVWVANARDGTVSRIDARGNRVVSTVDVGGSPQGLAVARGLVWVSVDTGGAPAAGVVRGGTARILAPGDFASTDPARNANTSRLAGNSLQLDYATGGMLLSYPDRPAPEGDRLVPDLARAMPSVSPDGRTYTFRLRPGLRFSPPSGEPVTAAAFKREIERVLAPATQAATAFLVADIVGASAYSAGRATHVRGVVARGDLLTITLRHPQPDFPARIANPAFAAVPPETPVSARGLDAIPSAGPYYIASHVPGQRLVLRRNLAYRGTRPHRLDEIDFAFGDGSNQALATVLRGAADYLGTVPPAEVPSLARRFGQGSGAARRGGQRFFANPTPDLQYFAFNTARPLFAGARMRRSVNYALDRRALARQVVPYGEGRPTDQSIPFGIPGFRDAQVYPLGGPDIARARRLAAGRRGPAQLYTCNLTQCVEAAQILAANLRPLGIAVTIHQFPIVKLFAKLTTPGEPWDIGASAYIADYGDPSSFVSVLFDPGYPGGSDIGSFSEPVWTRRIHTAAGLAGPARLAAYGRIDTAIARTAAPIAAFADTVDNELFSARMGCQSYQPLYGMDLAALCVR
ncbi:MAG: ABC transporter substrate-binding protein [Thermoleophilaceae bacterium]